MHGLLIFLYQHSSGLSCHGSSWHGEVAGLVETAQKTGHFFKKYCMLKATITVHLWVSSVPEYHRPRHTWSRVRTDLGSQTAEVPLIRYTPGHSQRRSLSWRIWDFMILSYIHTCSGAEDHKCQAWVLCWWHWPADPSLCQPSSHWQLTSPVKLYLSLSPFPPHSLFLFAWWTEEISPK